ncbi:hypothetical protein [Micromonospora sp. CPCC 205561]|uniref:hypothetical protein n=1 Tax=Micromonospora sp. CPCC 205561 TaxID=3122407 RepID=UPI002FF1F5FD
MSKRTMAMSGPRRAAALSFVVAATAAFGVASPAEATSAVATYGKNWGRSIGVNEDTIVACDGEDDGISAYTQYLAGNAGPGAYWTVRDSDGANNGCAKKDLTKTPYYAIALRVCEPPGGDSYCGDWVYTDGPGGK